MTPPEILKLGKQPMQARKLRCSRISQRSFPPLSNSGAFVCFEYVLRTKSSSRKKTEIIIAEAKAASVGMQHSQKAYKRSVSGFFKYLASSLLDNTKMCWNKPFYGITP
jgi:hypothetical protein